MCQPFTLTHRIDLPCCMLHLHRRLFAKITVCRCPFTDILSSRNDSPCFSYCLNDFCQGISRIPGNIGMNLKFPKQKYLLTLAISSVVHLSSRENRPTVWKGLCKSPHEDGARPIISRRMVCELPHTRGTDFHIDPSLARLNRLLP